MEQKIFIRRTEDEVLQELREEPRAYRMYLSWNDALKERFMAFCMGKKTLPVLYDTVFKMLMHPDLHPERLEDCVSCLLKKKVKFKAVHITENTLDYRFYVFGFLYGCHILLRRHQRHRLSAVNHIPHGKFHLFSEVHREFPHR